MHAISTIPGTLAALERMPVVVERVRATRQPRAGRRAGPGGALGPARPADEAQRIHAGLLHRAACARYACRRGGDYAR